MQEHPVFSCPCIRMLHVNCLPQTSKQLLVPLLSVSSILRSKLMVCDALPVKTLKTSCSLSSDPAKTLCLQFPYGELSFILGTILVMIIQGRSRALSAILMSSPPILMCFQYCSCISILSTVHWQMQ